MGQGRPCLFYYPYPTKNMVEPELMVKMANGIICGLAANKLVTSLNLVLKEE